MLNADLLPAIGDRISRSLTLREETAASDAFAAAPPQIDNGDEERYDDKSGTYTKGVLQSGMSLADLAAYQSFKDRGDRIDEGSPTHPAYPTGHGAVAGACITVLKFFFDGTFAIAKPLMPTSDGTATAAYTPASGEPPLTVNGELHKLAHNIGFGHGIHAGIPWRSDTDTSIELGEAAALSYLRDRAHTYNEQFSISLTKLNGAIATISNP
jgi:hypothetical protein